MEPKIRFKGFEGGWKDTIWGNHIVSTHTGTNLLGEVSNKGIPLLKMGNIQRGFFDLDKMEYLAANQNPPVNCIANYGDFFYNTRNTLELVGKGATWMKIDGIYAFNSNIAICKLDGIDTFFFNYLYNTLRSIKQVQARAKGTTSVAAVYMRDLKSIELALPHISEQQAIASYFTTLDSQISASTSRLASLKQMKAASLQAMFPQEGETVPKIRFKGFEGEWKKVKLSEILTERHENSTITDSLPQLSFTIADGVIRPEDRKSNKRDFLIKDIDNKRYLVTKVGDIIYNPANVVYGAIHRNSLMNGVVSPIYKIFTTMQDSNFIECAVRRPSFITKLAMCTEGTVTKLKTLKPEAFLNMEVCITPSLEEQKLIGNYFTSLDRQISLQSQRLEKLKQIKSACLDKMFV